MLMNGASPEEVKKALADRLSYKAAHRADMEKAPVKKLSDIDPISHVDGDRTITPSGKTEYKADIEPTEQPEPESAASPADADKADRTESSAADAPTATENTEVKPEPKKPVKRSAPKSRAAGPKSDNDDDKA